ncbi:MAG: AsmA family protein [Paludibacteraceae bacterium]|nr:AsmA family protein [Paludibacteraceae bacterium]
MKKALKIIGWTLLGIVLTVVLVVCIAMYVVFTPARLTPIARQAAAKFITCEHEIGEVDLTFFSTFPRFGLRADGLLLINPMTGAQNDTVVEAKHLTATVDVMEFLNHKNLHIHEAVLDGASVNFYINPDGENNLAVFVTSPDTIEEDDSEFSLPFKDLRVDGLRVQAKAITFVDTKDTIEASLGATELKAKAANWDDMLISLQAKDICARLKGETYADDLRLTLNAPMAADLNAMHFTLHKAKLSINEFELGVNGEVTLGDAIDLDAALTTGKWQIKPLLALVPAKFASSLSDLDVDGVLALEATARGRYSDNEMPLVTAHLTLDDGEGSYKPLPYTLRNLSLNADADLNLNKGQASNVTINSLSAETKQTKIDAKGSVDDLLGNMLIDMQLSLDANLPDFSYFLPKQMELKGRAKGTAKAKIKLDDLTNMNLHKGKINADMTLTDIHYAMDSMVADLGKTYATIQIPNAAPTKPKVSWARIDLNTDRVDFSMATPLTAKLQKSAIRLEAGNVLSKDPVLYAAVGLQSDFPIEAQMDSMGGVINAPKLSAYAEYNTKDTTVMPVLQASIDCKALDGFFKDISAKLAATQLEAAVSGGRKDKSAPRLKAKLNTQALQAKMGSELAAKTGTLALEAAARYNAKGKNVLLQWNPRLKVDLKKGEVLLPERLPEPVLIPSIEFSYSNRDMDIDNSRIELGKSDLNLKGHVHNIGKWFRKDTILEGDLSIVSDHCDLNQLMEWFSADSGSEEQSDSEAVGQQSGQTAERSDSVSNPFLVPQDVNLALHTHMRDVDVFNQNAKDLKGGIYVNNGILILDEVGFVCKAAKLQLTAMYRTPRRNHLYVGMDYHMIDVDIEELIGMIPDLGQMMPMLSSFKGAAEFHLAAETYMNSQYKPKMSTLRGAAALTGKDLVVLDGETFSTISKLLLFNKKTENKIDSLNAEITIYKNEIDVYPLCVRWTTTWLLSVVATIRT